LTFKPFEIKTKGEREVLHMTLLTVLELDFPCCLFTNEIPFPSRSLFRRYEYKTADAFVEDFALMRDNAVTFNGKGSELGNEASAICNFVKMAIDSNREELMRLEEAVQLQKMSSGKKGHKRSKKQKNGGGGGASSTGTSPASSYAATANYGESGGESGAATSMFLDGVETTVQLGNLDFSFDGTDSEDDSTNAALKIAM
jgi:hypothetical protein